MNLLNNIFEAYSAHDFGLLDCYLRKVLSEFISKFHSPSPKQETLSPFFTLFRPSKVLTVKKNADFFDMLYRSEDEGKSGEAALTDGETKLSLSRDLSPKISPSSVEDNWAAKGLEVKQEWLKALGKVFSVLDSKAIKKLLLLLEHPKETTRKMVMVLFQILLQKTQNKVHFVEKCAIGFSPGVYVISRMKYVHSMAQDSSKVFACLTAIRKYFRTTKSKLGIENKQMPGQFGLFELTVRLFLFLYFPIGQLSNLERLFSEEFVHLLRLEGTFGQQRSRQYQLTVRPFEGAIRVPCEQ